MEDRSSTRSTDAFNDFASLKTRWRIAQNKMEDRSKQDGGPPKTLSRRKLNFSSKFFRENSTKISIFRRFQQFRGLHTGSTISRPAHVPEIFNKMEDCSKQALEDATDASNDLAACPRVRRFRGLQQHFRKWIPRQNPAFQRFCVLWTSKTTPCRLF